MPSSSDGGPSPSRGSSPSSPSNPSRRSPPPQSEPDASPAATHQPTAAEGTRSGGRLAGSCSWGKILEKRAKRALILSGPRHGVKSDRLLVVFGRTEDLSLKGIDLAARAAAITQKTLHLKQLQLIVRGGAENEGDTLRKRLYEIAGSTSFEIVVRAYSPNL